MADLFTSLVSIVPKPSTVTPVGPKTDNSTHTGTFNTNQGHQVQTPGK